VGLTNDPDTFPTEQPKSSQFTQWSAEDYRRSADVHEVAEQIVRRVVTNALGLVRARHDLDFDDLVVDDVVTVALGEASCLEPDDLSTENCEILYVDKELRELLKRALKK
jgi:hypothetical protein